MRLAGVILAGGMNRRMGGRRKALLTLDGRTFLGRQLEELAMLCEERILVTNEPEAYGDALRDVPGEVRVVRDLQPGKGPLAGLQTAMSVVESDVLWVVGCDMPHISAPVAAALARLLTAEEADAVIARLGGRLHPLHGVYHRRCLPLVEAMLVAGDYRVMRLFDRIRWLEVDETWLEREGLRGAVSFCQNINDPDDYEALLGHRS
ncbi:molybdenum cofactor guanylyltransferase [Paenibacillus cremeus]|uniref:Probable molybdenum cofactor guanylyltransferase n=1 Tax=Paenibacillus cremeus TaxID=2163881 RepID=A0A559K083_9BACL|nr:molybdenum cofactor guanylyltransferase [Paenibacillus cremeus]TVY05538.1 molybdenum cofactor guanylyltransferase [Paenibacillus cremeus]